MTSIAHFLTKVVNYSLLGFDSDKLAKRIIEYLANRKNGYSRKELLEGLKISDGEDVGKTLKALIGSDFVLEYVPYGKDKKTKYYKLVDLFCMFYIKYVKNITSLSTTVFIDKVDNHWLGTAFENLCYSHLNQIKQALGITGIKTIQFSLNIDPGLEKRGAQIDLLIERKDNVIHLCEVKYSNKEYVNNKDSHLNLLNKIARVKESTKTNASIYPVLITTIGLLRNEYQTDYSKIITLDDLFKE